MYRTYRVFLAAFALVFFFVSAAASPIDIIETRNGTTIEKRAFSSARMTYFVEKGYGACGKKNKDADHVRRLNSHEENTIFTSTGFPGRGIEQTCELLRVCTFSQRR